MNLPFESNDFDFDTINKFMKQDELPNKEDKEFSRKCNLNYYHLSLHLESMDSFTETLKEGEPHKTK
jgi:hypothetical protein